MNSLNSTIDTEDLNVLIDFPSSNCSLHYYIVVVVPRWKEVVMQVPLLSNKKNCVDLATIQELFNFLFSKF